MTRVAICVATYQRPDQLRLLLGDLAAQSFGEVVPDHVVVVVADNDPGESARSTVAEFVAATYPHELLYVAVPERGVVPARNASVVAANDAGVDWMAFIDDDERPITNWLALLLDTAASTGASSVAGPVPERFSFEPPAWYTDAGLHIAESFPTGSVVQRFGVGNLLVSARALEDVAKLNHVAKLNNVAKLNSGAKVSNDNSTASGPLHPFDHSFNTTGGEDMYLGFQLAKAGHRMVWCDEAVATTEVPVERTEFRWVLRRQFNAYRNYSRALRVSSGSQPWVELVKSVARLAQAAGKIAIGAVTRNKGAMAAGAHLGAGALGKFAGTTDRQGSGWWD